MSLCDDGDMAARRHASLDAEGLGHHFLVVEVMLHALHLLIVFMTFSGDEDDVAFPGGR